MISTAKTRAIKKWNKNSNRVSKSSHDFEPNIQYKVSFNQVVGSMKWSVAAMYLIINRRGKTWNFTLIAPKAKRTCTGRESCLRFKVKRIFEPTDIFLDIITWHEIRHIKLWYVAFWLVNLSFYQWPFSLECFWRLWAFFFWFLSPI